MKKLIFNGTLSHKQSEYRPMTIEVEKVVELRSKEFKNLVEHTLRDNPHVKACRDLMYISGKTAHCVLFLDADSKDGIIVESEGADYARKSQFIPNARALVEYNEFTTMEKQLHGILKGMADKIAELAHSGYKSFFFEKMLGDTDIKSVMLSAVGQLIEQRGDMQSVRIHDLDIAGQPEFTVEPKQTNKLKFYSPLVVEREADYETDWDSSGDLEQLSENEKIKCCTKINEAIRQSFDSKEERRGLMEYYNEHSAVNEKIYFYYCDKIGFKPVEFDISQTDHDKMLKVLIVENGKEPYTAEIRDCLEAKQSVVGGLIEPVYFDDTEKVLVYCDEEFLLKDYKPNRVVGETVIHGTFMVVGDDFNDEGECVEVSLTDSQCAKYSEMFRIPLIYMTRSEAEEMCCEESEEAPDFDISQS